MLITGSSNWPCKCVRACLYNYKGGVCTVNCVLNIMTTIRTYESTAIN